MSRWAIVPVLKATITSLYDYTNVTFSIKYKKKILWFHLKFTIYMNNKIYI